jgi:branched-chain amino acid transport system substrate-binding protein
LGEKIVAPPGERSSRARDGNGELLVLTEQPGNRRTASLAFIAVVLVCAAAALTVRPPSGSATVPGRVACTGTLDLGLVTPLTGGLAVLGAEQLAWARYAVRSLAPGLGLKIRLVTGDMPVDKGPAFSVTLARKLVADPRLVGIVGPATSGAVAASSRIYFAAGVAHVSATATRTALTRGAKRQATGAFFRVVPADDAQGPSDAAFMIQRLKVKKVVLVDFQEPYSVALADVVQHALAKAGVSTVRVSVADTLTTFGSVVSQVPDDADLVFFPAQRPRDAQTFAEELLEGAKKAKVFGADRTNDAAQFKVPGSYVSNFVPDITAIAADKAIVAGWTKSNPGTPVGAFGPPVYGAVQVLLNAVKIACAADKGVLVQRRDVVHAMRSVRIPQWILGGSFRFSPSSNDPFGAHFSVFQIQPDGSYLLQQ